MNVRRRARGSYASRRGAGVLGALFLGLALGAGAYAIVTRLPSFGSPETANVIARSTRDVFGSREEKPILEIDLSAPRKAAEKSEKKSASGKSAGVAAAAPAGKSGSKPPAPKNAGKENKATASAADAPLVMQMPEKKIMLCAFAGGGEPHHAALLNEIAWMGTDRSASDEWMELRGNSGVAIELAGWQLMSEDGDVHSGGSKDRIVFDSHDRITMETPYLLERTDDESVPDIKADKIYSGTLSNAGTWLKLFDETCALVDEINASQGWAQFGGENVSKRTLERNNAEFAWHTSEVPGGTPRAKNSGPAIASPQAPLIAPSPSPSPPSTATSSPGPVFPALPGRVLISEIEVGVDGNANYEFVELYNAGAEPVALTGWSLKKKTSSASADWDTFVSSDHLKNKVIPAQKYFLLANVGGYSGAVIADVLWPSSYTLAYSSNSIALYDASGTSVDEVFWSAIPKNQSFRRVSWDGTQFVVEANPTPQNSLNN